MKTKLLSLALLAAFALPVSAQTYGGSTSASQPAAPSAPSSAASGSDRPATTEQYGQGGSKHCDQLTGAEKQTCLQDEGAKTDRKEEPAAAAPGGSTAERDASGGNTGMNATQSKD